MIISDIDNKKIIPYIIKNYNILNFIDSENDSILYYAVINNNRGVIKKLYDVNRIRFH